MKIFNTVQELWDHCTLCRLCGKSCRDISVSVGPDDKFDLSFYQKDKGSLNMSCLYNKRRNNGAIQVDYSINCLDNFCDVSVVNIADQLKAKKIKESYFYFYIESTCDICGHGITSSLDLEINETKHITNIGLERESYYVLKEPDRFHITTYHDRNVMYVSRCYLDEDSNLIEDLNPIKLPLVNLDFSNQHHVVEKIKTLILFS